jgi:hypothetical protein
MGDRVGDTAVRRTPTGARLRRSAWVAAAAMSLLCALAAGGVLASSSGQVLPRPTGPGANLQLPPGSSQLIALSVNAASSVTPPPTPPPALGTNANAIVGSVVTQLVGQLAATADKGTAGHISNAIKALNQALSSNNWVGTDGNHVGDKSGPPVFDRVRDAIGELEAIKKPQPPWVGDDIGYLDYAARLIASTLLADNSCSPQKPGEVSAAQKELSNGDSEFGKTHFHEAVDHYKSAWNHAGNANGVSCAVPGITSTPAVLFNVTNLVPLDQRSAQATVTVTGTSGSVTLSETNLLQSSGFADRLQLTAVDLATPSTPIYQGSLSGLAAQTPITVCGSGPSCTWLVNEQHVFTFTVTFPTGTGDNSLQGATASATLVWNRT